MTRIARLCVVTGFIVVVLRPADADIVSTGTADFNFPASGGAVSGTLTYENATRTVFGTEVNACVPGDSSVSGSVTPLTSLTGTFAWTVVGTGCAGCDASCNACNATCPLCSKQTGEYICSPAGCQSGDPISFVGDISKLTGALVANLPADLSYTVDAKLYFDTEDSSGTHYVGAPVAINAFQPVDTPTGSDETVSTRTTFLNAKTEEETTVAVDVRYGTVGSVGTTVVTARSTAIATLGEGGDSRADLSTDTGTCSKTKRFACETEADCPTGQTCTGYHGFFFDVRTTATVSDSCEICTYYPDEEEQRNGQVGNGYVDGTGKGKRGLPAASLRILVDQGGGDFVDVTNTSLRSTNARSLDLENHVLCAELPCQTLSQRKRVVTAVRTDIPGGRSDPATDCVTEWSLCQPRGGGKVKPPKRKKKKPNIYFVPEHKMTCVAGKGKCQGAQESTCSFCVRICPNMTDSRLGCVPTNVLKYTLQKPSRSSANDIDSYNAGAILNALQSLAPGVLDDKFDILTFNDKLTSPACTYGITLLAEEKKPRTIKLRAVTDSGMDDLNKLTLACNPPPRRRGVARASDVRARLVKRAEGCEAPPSGCDGGAPNGACNFQTESCVDCLEDCGLTTTDSSGTQHVTCCGDGVCEAFPGDPAENAANCPSECQPVPGNGVCEPGESYPSEPACACGSSAPMCNGGCPGGGQCFQNFIGDVFAGCSCFND